MPLGKLLAVGATVAAVGCGDNITNDAPPDAHFDQTIEIDGLSAPVGAFFDELGVLHLSCATDSDCFAAQGYFHAAHRFFQMDLRRRLARGRVAEVAGSVALPLDINQRLLFARRDGTPVPEAILETIDDDSKAAIEAYTRGVNAWIADLRANENGAKTAPERDYEILDADVIDDWTELDSIASVLLLADNLTNTTSSESALGEAYAKLGATVANDIYTRRPVSTSTIAPQTTSSAAPRRAPPAAPTMSAAQRAMLKKYSPHFRGMNLRADDRAHNPSDFGSNNWVIGPDLADGKILLENDTHLALSNPSVFYLVHIDAKTNGDGEVHAAGMSFPGLPGILIGRNEDIAWGLTNTSADFVDLYMEQVTGDGTGVMLNGSPQAFIERTETFAVAGQADETRTLLYVPHHGPVVSGPDLSNNTAVSARWTLADTDTDLAFISGLMRATSVAEAEQVLRNVTTAGQNFVVIDRAGNFGWYPYNRWPRRPWAGTHLPWLPIPGTGEAEWGEPIPYDEIPQLTNPAQGYIATANNDFTGALLDGDPTNDGQAVIQWFADLGFRHQRISDLIEARNDHDLASIQQIGSDVYSLFGEYAVPSILADAQSINGLSSGAQSVVSALAAWDFQCPTGLSGTDPDSEPVTDASVIASSAGCTAFHVLFPRLKDGIFADELDAADVDRRPYQNSTLFALVEADPFSGRDYFDDVSTAGTTETRQDVIAAALEETFEVLDIIYGPAPGDWLWGRVHTARLAADLFSTFSIVDFDSASFANDGGFNTVDVAAPRDPAGNRYDQRSGSSFRFTCQATSPDEPMTCEIQLAGGQRHHRDDPFYLSLLPDYLQNRSSPFRFDIAEAQAAATESIRLAPETAD